jgi:hypothetical protein
MRIRALAPLHPTKAQWCRSDVPADIDTGCCRNALPHKKRKGDRMTRDGFALAATIILLVPMFYFAMAALTFLLVRLDIPTVTRLLRGLFSAYFLIVSIAGGVGTPLVSAADGRPDQRAGFRRRQCGAPAAPTALGRHGLQRGAARRAAVRHSLRYNHADLIDAALLSRQNKRARSSDAGSDPKIRSALGSALSRSRRRPSA